MTEEKKTRAKKVSKREFTIPMNQVGVEANIVSGKSDDIVISIPENMTALQAKRRIWWAAQNLYRWF